MPHPSFKLIRSEKIASLNLEFQEYVHRVTGARHYHMASEDSNNAFMVAFRTVPQDSTGVAHILEHTTLCGSRRYPVRDPFFMMTRRSLSTFMNAFTASDWTAYPFATQSPKDFDNLLRVYLDATFFPNLDALDFAQEGHRVEFEQPDDSQSNLVYKGVVFNEMKGAMSSPVSLVWQTLQSALFPTNTYHHNSGGDPEKIPDLTYRQLLDFHASHYHPSNAIFMTYGSFPVDEHQQRFEELALSRFERQELDLSIPDEGRFTAPLSVSEVYALDGESDTREKTHTVLGWLLGRADDIGAAMDAHMLSSALLDNSASPLRHALEGSDLGTSPSELCGLDDSFSEMMFACGLEGSEPEHAEKVEGLILDVLQSVAKEGIPKGQLDSILHQLELHQREVGGGHFPYGLQLMMKTLSPILHGGNPLDALDIDPVLERLRRKIEEPDYIPRLVKALLLENPHRINLCVRPDTELSNRQAAEEAQRLQQLKSGLDEKAMREVIRQAQDLKARQESEDNPDLLPCVTIEDVPEELKIPLSEQSRIGEIPLDCFTEGTNGLVYQQIVVELPALDADLVDELPLFCDLVSEVGYGTYDYLQVQEYQASITGGVSARISMRTPVSNPDGLGIYFVLSGKALTRNQQALGELLKETFEQARLDELPRLRELVSQIRSHRESSVTQQGHRLAMMAASAGISHYAGLTHRWDGLKGIQNIIDLDRQLDDPVALNAFSACMQRIKEAILRAPRRILLVSEGQARDEMKRSLDVLWGDAQDTVAVAGFSPAFGKYPVRQAWTTSTQVNFCSLVYPVVKEEHPDAPALMVLGHFLRNGFLHRAIREQGGAYGGGASYEPDAGAFRFYSYRDPRLLGTLSDFEKSLDWLQNGSHEPRSLEEAILGVISDIDRPGSPASEAIGSYFGSLHGRTPEHRRSFRARVMQVGMEDLKRVAETYLAGGEASIAVITDTTKLKEIRERRPDLQLEQCRLG